MCCSELFVNKITAQSEKKHLLAMKLKREWPMMKYNVVKRFGLRKNFHIAKVGREYGKVKKKY